MQSKNSYVILSMKIVRYVLCARGYHHQQAAEENCVQHGLLDSFN